MDNSETMIPFSLWGEKIACGSGIEELMNDLGKALAEDAGDMAMLGGGNPSPIPVIQQEWRTLMQDMLTNEPERFDRMLGNYDPQQGNSRFIKALTDLFNSEYGWKIGTENISITNGGQTAFFFLFNLLAGQHSDGSFKRILFPMSPDYIGYAEQGISPKMMQSVASRIEELPDGFFKYLVDFESLPEDMDVAAACVTRPTNPTGNVLTDQEIIQLHQWCQQRGIPLIIDNAYGTPFPNIIFKPATPFYDENVILTYSLSKLGLPGTRTGIVIGPPQIIEALSCTTAITGLANGNIGQSLTLPLFESGRILDLSRGVIRPFYEERSHRAIQIFQDAFADLPLRIHISEGALFLWLWFPELPITTSELYQRLKTENILVIPGHYFFHNLEKDWVHREECIRIHYAMNIEQLPETAQKMARIVRHAYEGMT